MAQGGVPLDRETFSCSICLDLLKEPVTIPCGHSYCSRCIKHHWDGEGEEGRHSCPQCRKRFRSRPELLKNIMLAALVEQLKKTGVQDAPADHCYAGDEDVACDVCTGRKLKALKSCLVCLVSYCGNHLQPHRESPAFAKHQLVEPSKNLQETICSRHDEVMKMFCRSDQQCVCHVCVDQHKGHDIVTAAAERREKQEKLQETRQTVQQRIQDREEDVKVLQQEVKDINLSADQAVEHSQKIYRELIRLMEKRSSEVKQQIRFQQEAEVRRVQKLQEKLEQEMAELRTKDAELQQMFHTENHRRFLLNYSSASHLPGSPPSSSVHLRPRRYFEDLTAAVSEGSQKIQELLRDTWTNISLTYVDVLLPQPRTRAEFLRYSRNVTLDPNTAHLELMLSEENRTTTRMENHQPRPDHPDRFIQWPQVLSRESLTGRCYWEVKLRTGGVGVAVAYKNISRDGAQSGFGVNNRSWSLVASSTRFRFGHNQVWSPVSGPCPWSSTVGVYLDHPAGLLSFYYVGKTMILLHRVQTSFSQPLYAGLYVSGSSSAELVKLG